MPTPSPTPGPPARIPDPGTRPTPTPAPAPQKPVPPAPTDDAEPGLLDKLAGLIPGVDELGDIEDAVRAVRAWITDRHNWARVAWFGAGVVLFGAGVVMVGQRPVTAAATLASPVGRVLKKTVKG